MFRTTVRQRPARAFVLQILGHLVTIQIICYLDKTILVLGEAESIIAQLESLQMNDYYSIFVCWMVLDDLIKNLAKVIAMDAHAEFCTYELLASACKHVCMINNLWTPPPEEAHVL